MTPPPPESYGGYGDIREEPHQSPGYFSGHTCGIQAGNGLFCWGVPLLDNPNADPDPDPTVPERWVFGGWASVSAGGLHSVGLRATDDSV